MSNGQYNSPNYQKDKGKYHSNNEIVKNPMTSFDTKWINEEIAEPMITFANDFGRKLANFGKGLTTSQIRNFFGELRRIQMNGFEKEYSSFLLLEPKLAYAVKRKTNTQGKDELDEFYQFFKTCKKAMDLNNKEIRGKQFENLIQVMEAIIAYHKYHGGKE